MAPSFKQRFRRLSLWSVGLFVTLFLFRLVYGFFASDTQSHTDTDVDVFSQMGNIRKNYASEKIALPTNQQSPMSLSSSQKFEKTASVTAKSSEFENDNNRVKLLTTSFKAVIQYEQNMGQKGTRQAHLLIGVAPALFDSFYVEVQKIGTIKATQITKVDKTNEYRQLAAKITSIENTLTSLRELQSKGGQIADYVALNEKILDVEERLQQLGVEIGNFDTENEFCSVRFSIYEGSTEKNISFLHRIKVALEWSLQYFAMSVFIIFVLSLTFFILLLIVDKLKIVSSIKTMINKPGENSNE